MRALGFEIKKEEVKKMLTDINKDANSQITYDDFVAMMAPRMVTCNANDRERSRT